MLKGCASLPGIIFFFKVNKSRVTFLLLFCFNSSIILIMCLLILPYFFHRFLSSFTFSSTHYQMRSLPIFFSIYGTPGSFTLKQQILTINYEGCRVLYEFYIEFYNHKKRQNSSVTGAWLWTQEDLDSGLR